MSSRELALILTTSAQEHLEDIHAFGIARWGQNQADRYNARINEALRLLRSNPLIGKSKDEIRPGFRTFPVGSHIVFYQVDENFLTIHGIFGNRMDIRSLLD
jgi:toxin ParE1/3/4